MKHEDFSKLAMWEDWQRIVERSLPNFAESPIFVQQRSQTDEEFERAAEYVKSFPVKYDPFGMTRDARYGGLVRDTKALGPVTRMWIDTNVEIDFLTRHLGEDRLRTMDVLDIGAGYGRLAVGLSPHVREYVCVDAVPISTVVCRQYVEKYAPSVYVPDLVEFVEGPAYQQLSVELAINVHSWNECSLEQIENWLKLLRERNVQLLFTVSNGSIKAGRQAYSSWGGKGESFRPLLEKYYNLEVEESIGLSEHPHAIWSLKC
jgi:SAM-dependent methyltransferase